MTGDELAIRDEAGETLSKVLLEGNLEGLSPKELIAYYDRVCAETGLSPWERPFDLIRLDGKMQLYPNAMGVAQLARKHGISVEHLSVDVTEEFATVTVRATRGGQSVDDVGIVVMSEKYSKSAQGMVPTTLQDRANFIKKAYTQARRRAILNMMGLGTGSEEMTESMAGPARLTVDYETGEIMAGQANAQNHARKPVYNKRLWELGLEEFTHRLKGKGFNAEVVAEFIGSPATSRAIWDYINAADIDLDVLAYRIESGSAPREEPELDENGWPVESPLVNDPARPESKHLPETIDPSEIAGSEQPASFMDHGWEEGTLGGAVEREH